MKQRQLAQSFVNQVVAEPGGENLYRCFNCGTCTSACPISWIDESYNPRRIIRMIVSGMRDRVLSSPSIWLCSACDICYRHCPQNVHLSDLMEAARNVAIREGYEPVRRAPARANERMCSSCGLCVQACPYEAIELMSSWVKGRQQSILPEVNKLFCRECGICTTTCPVSAIGVPDIGDQTIATQITEFANEMMNVDISQVEPDWEPRIVAFLCEWCLYSRLDRVDIAGVQEQPDVRIVRVPCLGRVDPLHILTAMQEGIDGVLVAGCRLGDCHYKRGSFLAENRMVVLRAVIEATGEKGRVRFAHVSTAERGIFPRLVEEVKEEVKALGPIEPFGWPLSRKRGGVYGPLREEQHQLFPYRLVAVQPVG